MPKVSLIESYDYMTVRVTFDGTRLNLTVNRWGVKGSASGPGATRELLDRAMTTFDRLWAANKYPSNGDFMRAVKEMAEKSTSHINFVDAMLKRLISA